LREQIVSDANKIAPNPHSLWDGVSFTSFLGESATE
jgi:hypothetical protein